MVKCGYIVKLDVGTDENETKQVIAKITIVVNNVGSKNKCLQLMKT